MVLDELIHKILLKLIEVDYRENPLEIIRQDKQKVVKNIRVLLSNSYSRY